MTLPLALPPSVSTALSDRLSLKSLNTDPMAPTGTDILLFFDT